MTNLQNHINFLKINTIAIGKKTEFDKKDCFFRVKKFYNLSDVDELEKLNKEYEGRIPKDSFIIADADNGDYVLMNAKGNILFRNHETNDLGYDTCAEKPAILSKNLSEFLAGLKEPSDFDTKPVVKSIKVSDDFNDLFKDYLNENVSNTTMISTKLKSFIGTYFNSKGIDIDSSKLDADTNLYQDLELNDLDVDVFMKKFIDDFNIDDSDFKSWDYFGTGINIVDNNTNFLKRIFGDVKWIPLEKNKRKNFTLSVLEKAIQSGKLE